MKRLFIIIILAITCGFIAMAQDNPVSNHTTGVGDHDFGPSSRFVRAGITLTYNADTRIITVNGLKDRCNYAVTLQLITTQEEWNDEVSLYSNVIDVSYLLDGKYKITLESEEDATYTFILNIGGNGTTVYDGTLFPQGGGRTGTHVLVEPTTF